MKDVYVSKATTTQMSIFIYYYNNNFLTDLNS